MLNTLGLQHTASLSPSTPRFRGGIMEADDHGILYKGQYYSQDAWDTMILENQKSILQQTLLIQHLDKPILKVGDKPVTILNVLKAIQDNTRPRLGDRFCNLLLGLTGGVAARLSSKVAKKAQKAQGADIADIAKSLGLKWAPVVDYARHTITPNSDVAAAFVPPDSAFWKKNGLDPSTSMLTYVPELDASKKSAYRIELSPLEQALRTLSDSAIVTKSPETSYFNGYSLNHHYGLAQLGRKALANPDKLKQKFPLTLEVTSVGV